MSTPFSLQARIQNELDSDRADDDVTTRLLGDTRSQPCEALLRAKQDGVFSGLAVLEAFREIYRGRAEFEGRYREGQRFQAGETLIVFHATVEDCLTLERTFVNYFSHLCGVATQTASFVEAVRPYPTRILATRKTLPGMRDLQLQAVRAGGGRVHRRSLADGILIKDNHQFFAGGTALIAHARETRSPLHRIEIEVQDLDGLREVLGNPPDVIMLDNLSVEDTTRALSLIDGRCEVELSGGMDLRRVREYAALGVQYISVGRLTHSVAAVDLSLDVRAR